MRALTAILIALAFAALPACSPKRAIEATRLIADIAAVEEPSALKRETPEPTRRTVAYAVEGRHYVADIYRPGGGLQAEAAAVFVPGVVRAGKDDPRLVAFAKTFARARFLVFVPDIPGLRTLTVSATDARVIADAMRHLTNAGGFGGERPLGLFAFSYAAGPALIAAMEPDTRHLVRFVYTVGAYYSIESAVTFLTTGHYRKRPDDPWRVLSPNPYAQWVFLLSNAGALDDLSDRAALTAIAERKLDDVDADVSDLAGALGPEGRSVYALLTNQDPERVDDLLAEMPDAVRREMDMLDLKRRDLSALEGKLILIHGRDDPMIPYTESLALARAAPRVSELFVIDSLGHVEPRFSGLPDVYKLWKAAYKILAARDAMPDPTGFAESASSAAHPCCGGAGHKAARTNWGLVKGWAFAFMRSGRSGRTGSVGSRRQASCGLLRRPRQANICRRTGPAKSGRCSA